MAAEELEVTIEIRCVQMPAAPWPGKGQIHLGIQKDQGIVEAAPVSRKSIVFRPVLRVRRHTDGTPNFLGPFAHGPRAERFLYLVWGAGTLSAIHAMVGRIKLHLNHLTWAQVTQAQTRGEPLRVTLPLTNAKGGAVCASVRPGACQWERV